MTATAEPTLATLLDFLKETRGFDFTGYKRSSLERRIGKRMADAGAGDYQEYLDLLEAQPAEFEALFNTILINVTSFFRDPDLWAYLREHALPDLLARRGENAQLRIWSAGCSSGAEAYSMAMMLAELMGVDAYRECVKLYATDLDDEALDEARAARYTPAQVEGVPPELLERYFEPVDDGHRFRSDLRRTVIFGRNDLVQDPPISRIDVLLCRNTLMYFSADTQAQIVRRFHYALRDDGILVLGRSEMLVSHADVFEPVEMRQRVFRPVAQASILNGLRELVHPGGPGHDGDHGGLLRERAFDRSPGAQLIVSTAGHLVAANGEARGMFSLGGSDLGRPFQDLEVSYRPADLRTHLDAIAMDLRPVRLDEVPSVTRSGDERIFEVRLAPLVDGEDQLLGTLVSFADVTAQHGLRRELERHRVELGQAHEELQSTIEELETTNEELQSTNEELETTNEELQSTNEELETLNEEFQERASEVEAVNLFLETILSSMGTAVAVVDPQGLVQVWNSHAENLWGLRADEVTGQDFLGLDIGLPVAQLTEPLKGALTGAQARIEIDLEATNRRGRSIVTHVSLLPLTRDEQPRGAIVLMSDGA